MKYEGINVGTGRIKGLTNSPYYFEPFCFYVWSITFSDTSTMMFDNMPYIKVGETEEEANHFCNQIKSNFKKAGISEKDRVSVLYENDGSVIAIGKKSSDSWIDCTDKFAIKSIEDLGIVITFPKE